jgi:hypothetical protein
LEEVDLLADQVLWLEQGAVKGMVTPAVLRQQIEAEIAILEKNASLVGNENYHNDPKIAAFTQHSALSTQKLALSTQD